MEKRKTIRVELPETITEMAPEALKAAVVRRLDEAKTTDRAGRKIKAATALVLASTVIVLAVGFAAMQPTTEPSEPETKVIRVYGDAEPWVLTDDEHDLVNRVVQSMAKGESPLAMEAVAQCLRDASRKLEIPITEAVDEFGYPVAGEAEAISSDVIAAVDEIIAGQDAVDGEILYSYNPAVQDGSWHETQELVVEIGGLRFFR